MEVLGVSIGDRDGLTEIIEMDRCAHPKEFDQVMVMLMAGRAAEELVFGSPSVGAGGMTGSDLSLATELAKKIEMKFGFGEYGPVFLPDGGIHDLLTVVPGLLEAVRKRLDRALAGARDLLDENRAALDAVAEALDRAGYLSAAEISELVATQSNGSMSGKAGRIQASLDPADSQVAGGVDG